MGFAHKLLRRVLLVLSSVGAMVLIFPLAVVIRGVHLFCPIRADRLFIGLDAAEGITIGSVVCSRWRAGQRHFFAPKVTVWIAA